MPAYVMTVEQGGKPKMTESDGTGEATCTPQPPPPNQAPGAVFTLVLKCHNVTMETFADVIHRFAGEIGRAHV